MCGRGGSILWYSNITLQHTLQNTATRTATHCNIGVAEGGVYCAGSDKQKGCHVAQKLEDRQTACCSVLQCVAVCCCLLQYVAVCCSVVLRVAVTLFKNWNTSKQLVAVCCSVLRCVAMCCSVLLWVAVGCCDVLENWKTGKQLVAVCCSVLQCVAYVALYCNVLL